MIEQIGVHRVKHGDVTKGIDDLMKGESADIVYSDPPWGTGNVKYWHSINKRQTGDVTTGQDYSEFLNSVFGVIKRYAKNIVFIEGGNQWINQEIETARKFGMRLHTTIDLNYRAGSKLLPMHLNIFYKNERPKVSQEYLAELGASMGAKTARLAIAPFAKKGGIILDPCCGMGYTAKAGVFHGMHFRGNELNSHRLSKTKAFLNKNLGT